MRLRLTPVWLTCVLLAAPLGAAPASAQNRPTPTHLRPATRPGAPIPMPPDRAADSYAIYSLLMPGQTFAAMSAQENATWAIADTTLNASDRNPAIPPQAQLKPPPGHARGFQEAVGDYQRNQYIRVRLTRKAFRLAHPFALLTADQVADIRAAKSTMPSAETRSRWAGYPGITFFSEVYFDAQHRSALVYMEDWCAHLCAAGSWIFLEKRNGQWVRQSGVVVPGA